MQKTFNRVIKYSIYSLVFLLPIFWLPFSFESFEFNKQYLLFFLVSIAFFGWLAKMVLCDKAVRLRIRPLDVAVFAFLLTAVLSAVFSVDRISSVFGFYGRFSDGLIGLLSLGLMYFLIANNTGISGEKPVIKQKEKESIVSEGSFIINPSSLIKLFLSSSFFAVLISYFSIFGIWTKINNFISLPQLMLQKSFNPASGSIEGFSVFLAVITVFLVVGLMFLGGRDYRSDNGRKKRITPTLLSLIFLIFALGLMLIIDFSPAWIVLLLSLSLFVIFALFKRIFREDINKLLLPIGLLIIAGLFLIISPLKGEGPLSGIIPEAIKRAQPEPILSQGESWNVGFGAAVANVKNGFLGSGIGTYFHDFSEFKSAEFNQTNFWQLRFDRAGSHIAEILGAMGFLGLLTWSALAGLFLLISWFMLSAFLDVKKKKEREGIVYSVKNMKYQTPLLMAFMALLIGQFVYYQNTVLAFTFWLVLGLSVVTCQRPIFEKKYSFKDFQELSLVFNIFFVILGIIFIGLYFFAVKFYLADAYYKKAIVEDRPIENLERAASLNPYQAHYRVVLARVYLNEALQESAKPAEERNFNALLGHIQNALNYARGGELTFVDKGETKTVYIKGATEIMPNYVLSWETAGVIYRDIQGLTPDALEWGINSFEKAIDLEPANPVLETEIGKLYLATGDKQKAKEIFERAKELKPDYIDVLFQLSLLYEQEKNLGEAVRIMEDLAGFYPLNTEILFQLGRLYFNNNQIDEAIVQFERVVALFPNHSNGHYSLGISYIAKGEKAKAIAEFEKVLELNPGNKDVQAKLAELREKE